MSIARKKKGETTSFAEAASTSIKADDYDSVIVLRHCNRHSDCNEADADTLLGFGRLADHCKLEACEDCFGY